mgnify:FL=1|jgi:hypothetical protein
MHAGVDNAQYSAFSSPGRFAELFNELATTPSGSSEVARNLIVRHRGPIQRVQGCCRGHTLFCAGVVRSHSFPARSRVGYAGYLIEGWHVDHVIVEAPINERWQRFDSGLGGPMPKLAELMDLDICAPGNTGIHDSVSAMAYLSSGQPRCEPSWRWPHQPCRRRPKETHHDLCHSPEDLQHLRAR